MHALPCHFVWSDGRVSTTLDDLLADADENRGQVAWHLNEGHLQEALRDQGYGQILQGLAAIRDEEQRVELLLQRLAMFHAMHRRWIVASDFRSYIGRIDKLFRNGAATLLPSVPQKLAQALDSLVRAVCAVEDADAYPQDEAEDDEVPTPATKPATKARTKAKGATATPAKNPATKAGKAKKQAAKGDKSRIAVDTKRIAKAAKDARTLKS